MDHVRRMSRLKYLKGLKKRSQGQNLEILSIELHNFSEAQAGIIDANKRIAEGMIKAVIATKNLSDQALKFKVFKKD